MNEWIDNPKCFKPYELSFDSGFEWCVWAKREADVWELALDLQDGAGTAARIEPAIGRIRHEVHLLHRGPAEGDLVCCELEDTEGGGRVYVFPIQDLEPEQLRKLRAPEDKLSELLAGLDDRATWAHLNEAYQAAGQSPTTLLFPDQVLVQVPCRNDHELRIAIKALKQIEASR